MEGIVCDMRYANLKKRYLLWGICITMVVVAFGGVLWTNDRSYRGISVLLAFVSCIPFYLRYESRKPQARELIIIAIMCALAISGRFLFAFLPGFKPVSAIVILTGMAFGKEAGFLNGSITALLSNMFFGQGPWTPFQMLTWGFIGLLAGVCNQHHHLEKKGWLMLYGVFAGVFFSVIMDIWSAFSFDGIFSFERYSALLITSFPFMLTYVISNCLFLWLMKDAFMKKLKRIKQKYGIGEEQYEICHKL